MRDRLEIVECDIVVTDAKGSRKAGISRVLAEYGTKVMLALDRGETVFVTSQTKADELNERLGG